MNAPQINFLKLNAQTSYRAKNIMNALKDLDDKESFYVHLEVSDCISGCTKETLFDRAFDTMPYWFFCDWVGLKQVGHKHFEPVFNRIRQAAWDAAQSEYLKDKAEWCAKWGCE